VINKKLNQIIATAVLALSGMVFTAIDGHADEGLSMMDVIALNPKADDPKQSFAIADEDGDGRVTQAEFRLRKMFVFDKMDVDRDQYLSRNEIPILKPSVFDAADTDRDGKVSAYEFNYADFARFDLFDINKDGVITFDELLSFRERMK
jgi:Ca2+-binding EF-hand superfamily protein